MSARRLLAATAIVATAALMAAPTPGAAAHGRLPAAYDLPEDGIRLEGIGVDRRSGAVYVSATNRDGTIYRAEAGTDQLTVWVGPRAGDNGRGIVVDAAGRVYVAGGPSGEVRVFDAAGALLAELPTGAIGSFLNDIWIAPDGAAYVTDSSLPVIWRVAMTQSGWSIEPWLDVSAVIAYTPPTTDFDLGGITSTPGGRYLLVTQGTTGQLWRISLVDKQIREVHIDGAPLTNADGIALRGDTLFVVQNFRRQITTLELSDGFRHATQVAVNATPADRTYTTAKLIGGRLLAVDSTFGFPTAPAQDRVVAIPVSTLR